MEIAVSTPPQPFGWEPRVAIYTMRVLRSCIKTRNERTRARACMCVLYCFLSSCVRLQWHFSTCNTEESERKDDESVSLTAAPLCFTPNAPCAGTVNHIYSHYLNAWNAQKVSAVVFINISAEFARAAYIFTKNGTLGKARRLGTTAWVLISGCIYALPAEYIQGK